MRAIWPLCRGAGAAILLAGCASETFAPDAAPAFLVARNDTPLYRLGPQQAAPPDARLAENERVRMLRREFGYSFMQLANGQTGYVANDDLKPAPPLPPPAPRPATEQKPDRRAALPAVEAPLPKPDMNASPEDAPAL